MRKKVLSTLLAVVLVLSMMSINAYAAEIFITRGEAMELLTALDVQFDGKSINYTDVPQSHPHYFAIKKITDCGLVSGYGNEKFGPDDPLTLTQLEILRARLTGDAIKSAGSGNATKADVEALVNSMVTTTTPSVVTKELGVGTMQAYNFGTLKLHAYNTKDLLSDECYILETSDKLITIEAPPFHNNLEELKQYITDLNKPVFANLLSSHPNGIEYFTGTGVYATDDTTKAMSDGGSIKGLIDGFVVAFGDSFDGTIPKVTNKLVAGKTNIGGVDFVITPSGDGCDIEIPAINVIYTHMLGADVHSIMAGTGHMDAMIATLEGYKAKGYLMVLSGHHTPEDLNAVDTKIAYVQKARELAARSTNANEFISAMRQVFPGYAGENYLEMTAGMIEFSKYSVITKTYGGVKIHTYLSNNVSPVVIEKDKLTIIDIPGDSKEEMTKFKAYVDSLGKPIDRIIISHGDTAHWTGVETLFPGIPLYSVAADEIKKAPEGASLTVKAIADGTQTIDGIKFDFMTNRTIGAFIIKLPEQKVVYFDHLGYVDLHIILPPLADRLQIMKELKAAGYTWFIAGHGVPMEATEFIARVEAYFGDVTNAVSTYKTPTEAKAAIVKKYPNYDGVEILDALLPLFYN